MHIKYSGEKKKSSSSPHRNLTYHSQFIPMWYAAGNKTFKQKTRFHHHTEKLSRKKK